MDKEVGIELIHIALPFLWTIIVVVIIIYFRKQIGNLLRNIGKIDILGVSAEFSQQRRQLIEAVVNYDLKLDLSKEEDQKKLSAVINRANKIQELLTNARILWVDNTPLANANIYRFLNSYGVVIDLAKSTGEAWPALKWAASAYDVVVTDMNRPGDLGGNRAGICLLKNMRAAHIDTPGIIFVAILDQRNPPIEARTITNDPIELIHTIMDVLERKDYGPAESTQTSTNSPIGLIHAIRDFLERKDTGMAESAKKPAHDQGQTSPATTTAVMSEPQDCYEDGDIVRLGAPPPTH